VGAGQAAKICNNMMVSVSMIATCEALHLGRKMGLDAATLSDIMKKSSGGSWVTEKYNPVPGVMPNVPAAKNYAGGFVVDLMLKDSDLAMRAANAAGAATPLGALANQIYRLHQQNGGGRLDFGSVWRLIEGMATKGKK
jgi:3-hydroxyisobutyrate dehydrogenase